MRTLMTITVGVVYAGLYTLLSLLPVALTVAVIVCVLRWMGVLHS